jgi:hypothetical protein
MLEQYFMLFFKRFLSVSYVPFITVVDEIFNYDEPWSVAGTVLRDGHRRILHIPNLYYSSTMPEVDCWRSNWKSGDEGNEVVSDAWVTCLLLIGCLHVSRLLLSNS